MSKWLISLMVFILALATAGAVPAYALAGDGSPTPEQEDADSPASSGNTTTTTEAVGGVQRLAFDELFARPDQYAGRDILLEGFYFHGWETVVLSERLEPTGFTEGHLWPRGWIPGARGLRSNHTGIHFSDARRPSCQP